MINIATFYDKEVWTYANCFLFPVWAVVKRMEKSAKTTGDINLPPVLHTLHQYPSIKPALSALPPLPAGRRFCAAPEDLPPAFSPGHLLGREPRP